MAKLVRAVFVRDPQRHQDILLRVGEEPAPHLAELVTNPACWEDGKLPGPAMPDTGGDADTKPAVKKAAPKPARGRKAADTTGDGGQ
ncbi:hypothetical protein [Streptomyces sp. NEAU-H3]|uniref:hypothetical protein n=1 Tax=Streptomyces sp. NEAU-H3 TaxID=2720636 RepID=UPI00143C00C2|nr:hypothetical protein [Streptomyces sp. NEAU-H3]NJA59398.1 hypothetical protein [Streptomyces sp. NEAU-H3]